MLRTSTLIVFVWAGLITSVNTLARDDKKPADQAPLKATPPESKAVEQLVDKVRKSIAVITFTGRDGKRQGQIGRAHV